LFLHRRPDGNFELIKTLQPEESLISLAETVNALGIGRLAAAFFVAVLTINILPARDVALWLTAILISELWQWRSALKMRRADVETAALKANFVLAISFSIVVWSSMGDLSWGVDRGAFQGPCMVLWMTQFMLAALYAFRSRTCYVIGTAIPMAAMIFALASMTGHMTASRVLQLLASLPGPLFAFALSRQTNKQSRMLDHTLKQLGQAAEDAARAASAKAEFLANMSHELRTPLTAILGFSELLQTSKALSLDDARAADRINTASRTLLTVVNDVLDFSKMEAEALELDAVALDPVRIMQDALDIVGAAAVAKGLNLRLDVRGAPVAVVGDPVRLRQVLFNLVNNALKFTSQGEIVGGVAFEALGENSCRVRFEVRDTGIGIAEDKRTLMFERFSQADGSITRQFGGTGLGLAICKRIVTLMKGVIDVDSQLGQGSVFWLEVELPVADHLTADPSAPAVEDWAGHEIRALVVEDHPANQELLRIFLETVGAKVHIVNDGAQAVDAYRRGVFDIILMDVQMPGMDGPEATRRIRALEPQGERIPIIAMTANVMPDQISAYLAAGMDAHLGKPIDSSALIQTVVEWAAHRPAAPAPALKTAI
jgi:signal transduction histidine kinase/ActR/RegA family two-component response regulator